MIYIEAIRRYNGTPCTMRFESMGTNKCDRFKNWNGWNNCDVTVMFHIFPLKPSRESITCQASYKIIISGLGREIESQFCTSL